MSGALVVEGARALLGDEAVAESRLLVEDGRVVSISARTVGGAVDAPASARRIDGTDLLLVPGLIELQLNGGFGHDFTAVPERIWDVGARLPAAGVTAFLPTIVSSPRATVRRAQEVLAAGPPAGYLGAMPLGLHLEGPYLSPEAAGAHDRALLRAPEAQEAASWTPSSGVRMVTLAPELPGALDVIAELAGSGVIVSAGHSWASYDEAVAGIAAGIRYGTHLFNAMPPIDHREPGLVAALLEDARVVVGIIPDGVHVHPALVRLVRELVGAERFSAVTDATAALGMPDGEYRLGDHAVTLADETVRTSHGRLAGSALAADEALRRLAAMTGSAPLEVVTAMSRVPAALLGVSGEHGILGPGARADFVLISPELVPVATFVAGEQVHPVAPR